MLQEIYFSCDPVSEKEALLHDVGKTRISPAILNKPGRAVALFPILDRGGGQAVALGEAIL